MGFKGPYAELLSQFVDFKRGLGYEFADASCRYASFDRLTIERGESETGVTKELAEAWTVRRPNESENTHYKRVMYLIQFSAFLNDLGYFSYVPPYPKAYKTTFTPYIFTQSEIKDIFRACDSLEIGSNMNSTANVVPAIFRLMYGTGIRVGEAVNLKVKNVNLEEQYLVISNSKNGKERLVPFSETVATACRDFRDSLVVASCPNDYFFVKRNGQKCGTKALYEWFRKVLRLAGIPHSGRGLGPRLHDLRHVFSVHSMVAMVELGLDLYYALPILSEYLGHQSLEATDKYVRLTSEMYPGLLDISSTICSYAFPVLPTNEEE